MSNLILRKNIVLQNIIDRINTITQLDEKQIMGITYLAKLFETVFAGGVLASNMGAGKTVQAICLCNYVNATRSEKPILIVGPKTIMNRVWKQELSKFASNLTIHYYQRNDNLAIIKADVILTTYDTIRRDYRRGKNEDKSKILIQNIDFSLIVADEAHLFKNEDTIISRGMKKLKGEIKLVITGTPMEHDFNDFVNIVDFIYPGYLTKWKLSYYHEDETIRKELKIPKLRKLLKQIRIKHIRDDIKEIRSLIAHITVRFTQEEQLSFLPKRIIKVHDLKVTDKQHYLFSHILKDDLDKFYETNDFRSFLTLYIPVNKDRSYLAYSILTLEEKEERGKPKVGKGMKLLRFCEGILQHPYLIWNHQKIVFRLMKEFEENGNDVLTHFALRNIFKDDHSEKMTRIMEIVQALPSDEKCVIFVDNLFLGRLLRINFKKRKITSNSLHGGLSIKMRNARILNFQTKDDIKVMIVSAKIGSLGISLTRANHVIMYQTWWTYNSLLQAICRVHRRGQTREVNVHLLLLKDTFENSIYERSIKLYEVFQSLFNQLETPFQIDLETLDIHFRNLLYKQQLENKNIIYDILTNVFIHGSPIWMPPRHYKGTIYDYV